jgi:hypothetical protein
MAGLGSMVTVVPHKDGRRGDSTFQRDQSFARCTQLRSLAALMPDGSPQSVPILVGREDDRILNCTGEGSLKAKNTRRDPRVSLFILDFHDPYKEAQLLVAWSRRVLMATVST